MFMLKKSFLLLFPLGLIVTDIAISAHDWFFGFFFIKNDYFMPMSLLSRCDIEIKYSWHYDTFIWTQLTGMEIQF